MVQLDLTDRHSLMASLPQGGVGAEIGVADGLFSQVLLDTCDPSQLVLVDPFIHQTKTSLADDSSNVCQEVQEARFRQARMGIAQSSRVRLLRLFSLRAVKLFENDFFDWWHLDGDHTQVRQDIDAWWPKLKPGGWATGHDYTMAGEHITVKAEVDAFVREVGLELFVTRGDTDIYEKNYPTWAVQKPIGVSNGD